MRNAFIDELIIAAEDNEKIVLIVGDLGYGVVEPFAKKFPSRFFNAGVAEQNMMGVASGLASEGFHVFVYSIGNFPTFRCAEQIRNDIDYHMFPVTIVVVGGGVAYGSLGYSHHAIQDYSLIRSMPNMLIAAPGDPMEVRSFMKYLLQNPQPSYLRLGKAGERNIHSKPPVVNPGCWLDVVGGDDEDIVYLTTGATLAMVVDYRENSNSKISIKSMPLWSMRSKAKQAEQLSRFDSVITVEDHLIDGGFGSWLMESVVGNNNLISKLKLKYLDSRICGMVANQNTLNNEGGLIDFQ